MQGKANLCWACGDTGQLKSQCEVVCTTCGGNRHGADGEKKGEFACRSVRKLDGFETQESSREVFGKLKKQGVVGVKSQSKISLRRVHYAMMNDDSEGWGGMLSCEA